MLCLMGFISWAAKKLTLWNPSIDFIDVEFFLLFKQFLDSDQESFQKRVLFILWFLEDFVKTLKNCNSGS